LDGEETIRNEQRNGRRINQHDNKTSEEPMIGDNETDAEGQPEGA